MKELRVECPSCQQPIEIVSPRRKLWPAISFLLLLVVIGLSAKIYSDRRNAWDERLKIYNVAILGDREQMLWELSLNFFDTVDQKYSRLTNSLATLITQPVILKVRMGRY